MGDAANLHETKLPAKFHALLVPFPQQGHINPMFKVAKLLHGRGFHITFANSEFCHRRLLSSVEADDLRHLPGFEFKAISSTDFDIIQNKNHEKTVSDIQTKFLGPVYDLVREINDSRNAPPVTCIISDPMMVFTMDVAKEFDIPILLLFVFAANTVLSYRHTPMLIENGILPLKGTYKLLLHKLINSWIDYGDKFFLIIRFDRIINQLVIGFFPKDGTSPHIFKHSNWIIHFVRVLFFKLTFLTF